MLKFSDGRFQTSVYSPAGEGALLYRGDSLRDAVQAARQFPCGARQTVLLWDHDRIDWSPETGTQGEVSWWDDAAVAELEDELCSRG